MANIVHRLISGVTELRPEPAVSCAKGRGGITFPLALIAFLLAACLAPGAYAATLMHNSDNVGTKYGTWGIAGTKYGQFTCTTCHEPGAANIKRIKGTITVPDPVTYGNIPGSTVSFQSITSFGDDSNNHTTSQRVCEVCHTQTTHHRYDVTPLTPAQKAHNNRLDCTTASCHPHSKAFAAGGCDGCHGNPPTTNNADNSNNTGLVWSPSVTGATNPLNAIAHPAHNNRGYACTVCHNGNTMPTVSYTLQMGFNFFGANRAGTFTGYTSLPNGYTFASSNPGTTVLRRNNYNNSCANLYCHGGGDSVNAKAALTGGSNKVPYWGSGASQAACGTCHATTGATYNVTGSHNAHANTLGISCSKCHGVISNNIHVDGAVFWKLTTSWNRIGASATYDPAGAVGPSASGDTAAVAPSASFGTCNNFYCHSDGNGSYPSIPTWGGSLAANCLGCHGGSATPASLNTLSHQAHMNNAAYLGTNFGCVDCHSKTVSSDTVISNSANHVNAFKDFSGAKAYRTGYSGGNCTTYCHSGGKAGAPAATAVNWSTGPAISDCKACHGVTGSYAGEPTYANGAAPLVNNHNKHVASAGDCVKCHFRTTSNGTAIVAGSAMHIDKVMNVNFSRPNTLTNYSGVYNNGTRTCSATYCHGGSAPVWGGSALACNQCHEASNLLPQGHTIHWASTANAGKFSNMSGNVSTAGAYRFTCSSCHGTNGTLHAGGPIASQSAADIFFGFSTAGRGAAANTAYNSTRPGTGVLDSKNFYYTTGGAGSCNSTYCHSNGRGGNGINAFYNWTSNVASLGCGGCHGIATTTGGNALSGRHEKHVNNATYLGSNFKCAECHDKTMDAASDTSITDKAKHVNKFIDYSGASAYKAGFNTGTKVCSTSWCHSNGKLGTGAAYTASVTWTTAAVPRFRCNQCHGNVSSTYGEPGYANGGAATATANNHTIHVVTKSYTCDKCHKNTVKLASYTTLLSGNTAHLNKNIQDVAFQGFSSAWRATTNYTAGTKTCNNIYCHSSGTGVYSNPVWGQGTLNCSGCHPTLSGAHGKHIGNLLSAGTVTFYNYTSVKSIGDEASPVAGDGYKFGCANCHPLTVANHLNGIIEVTLNNAAGAGHVRVKTTAATVNGTIGSGTVTCTAVFCHGDGKNPPAGTTIQWNQTFAGVGGDRCAKCHGNSPTTGAHQVHVVGIHYDNIYKGGGLAGKLAAGTGGAGGNSTAVSHGSTGSVQETVINCDICHYNTVRVKYNDKNAVCTTCHNGVQATLRGDSKLYSLANHVNGTVEFAFTAVANDATVRSKAQLRDGSFAKYTAAGGYWNRNGTYKTGGTAYDAAKTALSTPMYSAGNCSNIVCHNGKTVNWTNDVGKAAECVICHIRL